MATPVITGITGNITTDSTITINGSNFTTKTNAAPLFWWKADMGTTPSSLGRKTTWDTTFNGTFKTTTDQGAAIAPGSTYSVELNHNTSENAILGRINFTADQLYVWRKRYNKFDSSLDYARRTRYTNLSTPSAVVDVGSWVVGNTSGATGVVQSVTVTNPTTGAGEFWFDRTSGTINQATPLDYNGNYPNPDNAETLTVYAADDPTFTTPLYTALCNEGYGLFRTFNLKTIRFWAAYGDPNNRNDMYMPMGPGWNGSGAVAYVENTGDTSYPVITWPHILYETPYAWAVDEFIYQTSDVDTQNGIMLITQNGEYGYSSSDRMFKMRSSTYSMKFAQLYQIQVSNGAQPDSISVYDSLYVDDSWHRIVFSRYPTLTSINDTYIQIPTAWSDTSATVSLNLGTLNKKGPWYVYLVNGNNEISSAYPLFTKVPNKPSI